jgi:hypothetical protein
MTFLKGGVDGFSYVIFYQESSLFFLLAMWWQSAVDIIFSLQIINVLAENLSEQNLAGINDNYREIDLMAYLIIVYK